MDSDVRSWELVEHLFDASVSPERLDELIVLWDAQIERMGFGETRLADHAGSAFAHQVAAVLQVLEQVRAAELRRGNDLLSSMIGAAMVLEGDGIVVAANEAAAQVFGLLPGGTISAMPIDPIGLEAFAQRLAEVAAEADNGREDIVRVRPAGLDRAILVHLKSMGGPGERPRVLAITSELGWPAAVSRFLARSFSMTPAEIEVMRLLAAGGTVGGIAAASGRSPGTVRSQLHAVLEKTGARTQAEVIRLAILLLQSVPADAEPRLPPPPEPHQRFLRMPDGRRVEVLTFGDPAGRPVIWTQSTYGFYRLPSAAEIDMAHRGLRVVTPFRAGWCGSDALPGGRDPFDVAVADLRALMAQLRIRAAPVVAPGDDLRIALMLAQAEPERVSAVFGIGCGFPILTESQYRRLIPIARFVRACARYSPRALPFMLRGLRVAVVGYGVERYLRGTVARIRPGQAQAARTVQFGGAYPKALANIAVGCGVQRPLPDDVLICGAKKTGH